MNAEAPLKDAPYVFIAMAAVQAAMAVTGIDKTHTPKEGAVKYNFRGIDDVYAALSGLLAAHGLLIIPRVTDRDCREVISKSGSVLIYTVLTIDYDFISTTDGSKHTCTVVGEAMDTGDKSSNKAMSAAYKYMALQSFCIPLHGENRDSEESTYEISKPRNVPPQETGPVKMTKAQESQVDMEELVRQAANECGFPGNSIFNSTVAKNKSMSDLLKRLQSGSLKGPGGRE